MTSLPSEPSLYYIVREEANTPLSKMSRTSDCDLAWKQVGEWMNEFVRALQNNHDYDKYKEHIIELSKILGLIRKTCGGGKK